MPKRPLINYFGGKWRLAPWIVSHFPEHKTYIEPFGGSLSVLLRKERSKREIVNDLDKRLVTLYQVVRDWPRDLRKELLNTPYSRHEYKKALEKDPLLNNIEIARKVIVRSYMGIGDSLNRNSGFRNSIKSNTCPAKSYQNYIEDMYGITERLRGVMIECLDYATLFDKYDSKDVLWYLDPPYIKTTRSTQHGYLYDWTGMDWLKFIGQIKKLKGQVVLSAYNDDDLLSELDKGWVRYDKESNTQSGVRLESLWVKG